MKWIYIILLCSFSCFAFGQNMKIGFLDSNAALLEMQEFQYLDSVRINNKSLMDSVLNRQIQVYFEYVNKRAKELGCGSRMQFQLFEKEVKKVETKFLETGSELTVSDSLYKIKIKDYCKEIMNQSIKKLVKEKGIHLMLEESSLIYAENKITYTNELIQRHKKRMPQEWKDESFNQFLESLEREHDLFSLEIQKNLDLISKAVK